MLYKGLLGPYGIKLCPNQIDQLPNNLWLTGNLLLGDNLNNAKFFSKIVKCDLDTIYLVLETRFTINELKRLTQSQTVKTVHIDRVIYSSHDNYNVAPLEDILPCLLYANSILFDICPVTKETSIN
uniref:Uncharacterized protein n=1 Tax=Panagrolaimus superbus TaxID=310955 RepID=A0A914Z209_9BILA